MSLLWLFGTEQNGIVHAQVDGTEVTVGFEWGNEGSLSVDAKADGAANGVPPAESLADSPVQYSQQISAAHNFRNLTEVFTGQRLWLLPQL